MSHKKKDLLAPENATTKWSEISADELEARMNRDMENKKPISELVAVMDEALAGILMFLGIDPEAPTWIQSYQQDQAGVTIWQHDKDENPQLNGFYIHVGGNDFDPFAFVGSPFIQDGKAWCIVEMFMEQKRMKVGGIKLVLKNE